MKTIIEEMYEDIAEKLEKLPHSDDYEKIYYKVCELHDALEKTLNDTQKQILDDLHFEMSGLEYESSKSYFIRGFNYGIRLISEAGKYSAQNKQRRGALP